MTDLAATVPDASVVGAFVLGIAACISDIRTRRIPNKLTFGASAVAFAFFLATGGLKGLGISVAGWLAGIALFVPFFLLGGMGAGDVKLLAAFGAWLGPWRIVWTALFGGIAGGVLAVVVAVGHGYLRQAFHNLKTLLWHWSLGGVRPLPELTLQHAKGPRLAYAVPLTIGMVAALWLK